jgi:rubrerythrin
MHTAQRPEIKTLANLEAAFAGESMAHIKYRYFAKLAREMGDEATARTFEATADQEVMHAFGHLDLLYPKASMTPAKALQIAIEGETYEYTEMYPRFRATAEQEGHAAAVAEMDEQIEESKVHAAQFRATLEKAQKRFAALAKVEERHAQHYQAQLDSLSA